MNSALQVLLGTVASSAVVAGGGTPVPAAVPHRYWRVVAVRVQGQGTAEPPATHFVAHAEVQFMEAPGGPDETGSGDGTPIFSSQFDTTTNAAANAFDNNLGTHWASVSAVTGEWIGWDFGVGNARAINQIGLIARSTVAQSITKGEVHYSDDGVTWTLAWAFDTPLNWVNNERRVFTSPSVAYVADLHVRFSNVGIVLGGSRRGVSLPDAKITLVAGGSQRGVSLPFAKTTLVAGGSRSGVSLATHRIAAIIKTTA